MGTLYDFVSKLDSAAWLSRASYVSEVVLLAREQLGDSWYIIIVVIITVVIEIVIVIVQERVIIMAIIMGNRYAS